jgi:iron complex transport system substrate-binding protein
LFRGAAEEGGPTMEGAPRLPRAVLVSGALAVTITLAMALAACDEGTAPSPSPDEQPAATRTASFPITLTDDDGVELTVDAPPERLVTWAPSNTEILFALGLGDRVVGVSGPFDDFPPEAASIEQVGGAGGVEPDVERIVALEADLVLNGFLGGDTWKARLRDLGIPVFSVYALDLKDAVHDIRTVGDLTGAVAPAADVAADMLARAGEVEDVVEDVDPVSCFFEVAYPDLYTVAPQDFPYDLLERAGCRPVTEEAETPYPVWSLEQLVADDPDVYILTSEAGIDPQDVAARPGFEAISAVVNGRVHVIDSDLVTRPGPRVVQGLEELARILHPGLFG